MGAVGLWCEQVGHVHVNGGEASCVEREGHFGVAISALVTEDGDAGARGGADVA